MAKLILSALSVASLSSACAVQSTQAGLSYLSEDQVIDLMQHPQVWDGRTVTVRIYPYDFGDPESPVVCFEPCSEEYAQRSPFILYTTRRKFEGYRGDRAVVITARYSSTCFYRHSYACPDLYGGQFTEIEPQPSSQ
jgi:hypothetical protein